MQMHRYTTCYSTSSGFRIRHVFNYYADLIKNAAVS